MEIEHKILILEKTIEKLKKDNENLKNELNFYRYDTLTGLQKRSDFNKTFENKMFEYNKYKRNFILVMIDLNGLHELNREVSFEAGDEFIIDVSNNLLTLFDDCLIYRIGGDEFMMLKNGQNIDSLIERLDKIDDIEYGIEMTSDENNSCGKMFNSVDKQIISKKQNTII